MLETLNVKWAPVVGRLIIIDRDIHNVIETIDPSSV
jgi:hypothetical protein